MDTEQNPTNPDAPVNQRVLVDRRQRPTRILSRYTIRGRRKVVRRKEDRRKHIYVDRYGLNLFLILMGILALGTADGLLTLYHVKVNNAVEMNPIMNFFLGLGPKIFFHVKYVVTALCLLILCLHKNLTIVRYLLISVFIVYLLIVVNHIYLFFLVS
jgi:hypothetical protein